VNPLSFTSLGTPYTIDLTRRTDGGPKVRLMVYPVLNPADVPSREAFRDWIGQTILIDGHPKVVHSVESYSIGGAYLAGRPLGVAVVEEDITS